LFGRSKEPFKMHIMRKYFPGLFALIVAFALCGFTRPFTMLKFRLLHDPVVPNIVNNPEEWSASGKASGECLDGNDIACSISIKSSLASYFHSKGKVIIINTFEYANAQSPKQDYLVIAEQISGVHTDRIIVTISPMHYSGNAYVRISLGSDLGFKNGKD
jgi:hypothetical protein